ncbi:MAG: hypothetical protein ACJ76J_17700 [Thermoanaerobaculia bacterium]
MSQSIRRIAVAVAFAGLVALAPPPAQAWEGFGEVTHHTRGLLGSFHRALHRLFELSRGGMDPNGGPG